LYPYLFFLLIFNTNYFANISNVVQNIREINRIFEKEKKIKEYCSYGSIKHMMDYYYYYFLYLNIKFSSFIGVSSFIDENFFLLRKMQMNQ
jgi:hypothetical protein